MYTVVMCFRLLNKTSTFPLTLGVKTKQLFILKKNKQTMVEKKKMASTEKTLNIGC